MVKINGAEMAAAGKTVAEYLATTDYDPKRIAVERNGAIVPRALYAETVLEDGDVVEVVSFVGAVDVGRIPTREETRRALEERHGKELQDRLERAVVAVCGLGGLGSNIATALARAGVGRLILIDFDRVDITNLNRQQYDAGQTGMYKTEALTENLRRIAPYVELTARRARVDAENFAELLADADIICEAFDDAGAKAELANCVMESMPEKYLVAASGMAGMGPANEIRTRRIAERFYLCGDGISGVEEHNGLIASRVMLCAAHQAHAVMRIIAEKYEI